jgi:DNA-directed RNA polymerase subunit alpha
LQTFINFEEPKDQSPADEAEDLPFSRNLLRKVDELGAVSTLGRTV